MRDDVEDMSGSACITIETMSQSVPLHEAVTMPAPGAQI